MRVLLPTPDEPRSAIVIPGWSSSRTSSRPSPVTALVASTRTPTASSSSWASATATSTGFVARSTFVRTTIGRPPDSQAVARKRSSRRALRSRFSDVAIITMSTLAARTCIGAP